jgi:hypothetical protein
MTDSDDKLLRRYRSLAREEPPRAMDEAILAASRRALGRPTLARRWAAPVSIAAVLVLAFGVTLEMQREEPGVETSVPVERAPPVPPSAPPPATAVLAAPPAAAERQLAAPGEKARAELRKSVPARAKAAPAEAQDDQPPEPAKPRQIAIPPPQPKLERAAPLDAAKSANALPAAAPTSSSAPAAMAAPRAQGEMYDAAQPTARAAVAPGEPERELERIARLRDEGRREEADKALDEFRRKHPDFRIPEAMWERVRPR